MSFYLKIDMYITQGSNGQFSHQGTMANDVRGLQAGIRYPYYAPCTCKCLSVYPSSGQSMWQSLNPVRFANGRVDYATFVIAHDDTQDCYVGQIVNQGYQLGNMGTKGYATGVHCHIQIGQSKDTTWRKNKYGIYCLNNEYDTDDCYFVDDTNIINGMGGKWKTTSDVPVIVNEYINLPDWIEERNVYDVNTKVKIATLKPKKFGGLSYKLLGYENDGYYGKIKTVDFGECLVRITVATPITDKPLYKNGNY